MADVAAAALATETTRPPFRTSSALLNSQCSQQVIIEGFELLYTIGEGEYSKWVRSPCAWREPRTDGARARALAAGSNLHASPARAISLR